jgi:hypothetical protein
MNDDIAPLDETDSDYATNIATVGKALGLLAKEGFPLKLWQGIIDDADFRRRLAIMARYEFAQRFSSFEPYNASRLILGRDLITPEEIAKTPLASKLPAYGDEQLKRLKLNLPPLEVLCWLKENKFGLVAGPPVNVSLELLYNLFPSCFYQDKPWWLKLHATQSFASEEIIGSGWLALRISHIPSADGTSYEEMLRSLSPEERVPSAVEIAWFNIV